jgi:hypothetical protein
LIFRATTLSFSTSAIFLSIRYFTTFFDGNKQIMPKEFLTLAENYRYDFFLPLDIHRPMSDPNFTILLRRLI